MERSRVFLAGEWTLQLAVLSIISALSSEVTPTVGMGMTLNLIASSQKSASGENLVST